MVAQGRKRQGFYKQLQHFNPEDQYLILSKKMKYIKRSSSSPAIDGRSYSSGSQLPMGNEESISYDGRSSWSTPQTSVCSCSSSIAQHSSNIYLFFLKLYRAQAHTLAASMDVADRLRMRRPFLDSCNKSPLQSISSNLPSVGC
jgi:hypothetical protein